MKDKGNCHGTAGKSSSEQHFVNPPPLPLLCEISGALHVAQPASSEQHPLPLPLLCGPIPSATGSYGRLAGRQADEKQVDFKIFKVGCRWKYLTCYFV